MRILGCLCLVLAIQACAPSDGPRRGDQEADAPQLPASAPERPLERPARDAGPPEEEEELPRVVFFGTSLTAGLGLPSEDDTYVQHAAELAADAGVPFRPVNAGVSGETTAAGLRRIDWVLRAPVDLLVLELGANDGLRGLDVQEMYRNLTEIVRRARADRPEARILLLGMEAPPNMGERYTSAFRDTFRRVAEEQDTYFVPFFLDDVAGVAELNQSDGIHPTPEGHRLMARNLMPVLTDALEAVYADRTASTAGGVE